MWFNGFSTQTIPWKFPNIRTFRHWAFWFCPNIPRSRNEVVQSCPIVNTKTTHSKAEVTHLFLLSSTRWQDLYMGTKLNMRRRAVKEPWKTVIAIRDSPNVSVFVHICFHIPHHKSRCHLEMVADVRIAYEPIPRSTQGDTAWHDENKIPNAFSMDWYSSKTRPPKALW